MSLIATITPDCKFISLTFTAASGTATVEITNGSEYGYDFNATVLPNQPFNIVLNLISTVGIVDGVFEIELTDSAGNKQYVGAVGKCAINCCIAKKMDTILGCDCACKKCNSDLIAAERIHLLMEGVESDVAQISDNTASNEAYYESAVKKYNKAAELCSDSCGCSC